MSTHHTIANTRTGRARDDLISRHLGLVYHVARQLSRARAMDLELDELVSAGTLGLIEALNHFDAARGLAFSTFAAPRIRGAMLDELRRQDHVPRSVRRRARELHAATEELTKELGRVPEPARIAAHMGVDVETVFRWQMEGDGARFVPLEATGDGRSSGDWKPSAQAATALDPEFDERLNHAQEVALLRGAIQDLPPVERQVLSLYYFEDLKLSEIATILGVSESRVSQIRGRAVLRLRKTMGTVREAVA